MGSKCWSEEEFRARVLARCSVLGEEVRAVLARAGITHDRYYKPRGNIRWVQDVFRLADILKLSPPEMFGFDLSADISIELLTKAWQTASRMFARLPQWAQTEENKIEALANIYNALAMRQREGRPYDDETLTTYAEVLAARWLGKNPGSETAP